MRRLHWSSTSLGYMNPSTPGIIDSPLPDRPIQVLVIDLGLSGHIGLQNFDLVDAQKLVHGILRIFEIDQLPRAGGAILAAGGSETPGDAVVTERALVDRVLLGMQVAAAVGAGLDAVAASEAVALIHEHDAIGADEGG